MRDPAILDGVLQFAGEIDTAIHQIGRPDTDLSPDDQDTLQELWAEVSCNSQDLERSIRRLQNALREAAQ